ncbi:hypothetical protein chiPu_0015481 [Chiloscyllium punctatum]|uniref:Uncharacterized protein n=1 Tax=Chiloscyllium punctatum TaxID=137246 RepID=A0A401T2V4_CHIPU|nr:hypothetical protein [Chiloscyllium punctatum]
MSLSSSSTLPLIAECTGLTAKDKFRLVKPVMEKRCRVWLNRISSLKDLVETNIEQTSSWKKLTSWK